MTVPDPGSRPLVVVVDDEEDIAAYLRLALEDHGFETVAVSDSACAVATLEARPPAVICLDLLMPGQTGLALYGELARHQRLAAIPVVILSGLGARAELPELLRRSGNLPAPASYLDKPVDLDELVRVVSVLAGVPLGVAP